MEHATTANLVYWYYSAVLRVIEFAVVPEYLVLGRMACLPVFAQGRGIPPPSEDFPPALDRLVEPRRDERARRRIEGEVADRERVA